MAKPINLYQGPAPERVMAQMGAGMAEVGANIGRTMQRGYESMGQGIAGGIKAVGDAYQEYKDDEAKFNATKKMYKAFGGSLDENTRNEIDSIFADTSMSVREKNALAPTLMQFLGASNQQQQALAKQQKELDAAAARQRESLNEQAMAPFRQQAASLLNNPMVGTDFGTGQRLSTPPQRQRTDFFGNLVN